MEIPAFSSAVTATPASTMVTREPPALSAVATINSVQKNAPANAITGIIR